MNAIGYIILFYVGFYFYRLAENHKRNKWLFGFIGIAAYFFGIFIYPLYVRLFYSSEIYEFDVSVITLKSSLIGLLFVFFLFQLFSIIWSRKKKTNKKEIDKIGRQ